MANLQDINVAFNGFFDLPQGSVSQRPTSPEIGMIRYNTDLNLIEGFNGKYWLSIEHDIVREGLVFHIDAGDVRSYPGSGSSVFNLAPFTYTGTLAGDWSWDPQGWWDFRNGSGRIEYGVSDISTNPSQVYQNNTREITYEIWHYSRNIEDSFRLMSTDRSDYNCLMWDSNDDNNGIIEWAVDGDTTQSASGFQTGKWHHIVGTATGSLGSNNVRIYRDGSRAATFSQGLRSPMGDGRTRPFAVNNNVEDEVDLDAGADGNTAIVRIYGYCLSDQEVAQNFNAERARFGV